MELKTLLDREFVLLDGAWGPCSSGGACRWGHPGAVNLEHPEWLLEIHASYVAAGADIIYANTFGANREKTGPDGVRSRAGGVGWGDTGQTGRWGQSAGGAGYRPHRPDAGADREPWSLKRR